MVKLDILMKEALFTFFYSYFQDDEGLHTIK